jgi:hypothetical protein
MAIKQIRLPIGFQFSLKNGETGEMAHAPCAFRGYEWREWPSIPVGIEYEVEGGKLPQRFDYTVGPAAKIIRWDASKWEADEETWLGSGWEVEEVA